MNTDWMARGSCKDLAPETFFPNDGVGVMTAQLVCSRCQVKAPCLEYALANHLSHGVWGGTSERQRSRLQKARRSVRARPEPSTS